MSSPAMSSPAMSCPSMSGPPLSSPSMSSPSMSSLAMSTPAKSSVNVQSCNVQPCFYSSVNVQSCNFSQPLHMQSCVTHHTCMYRGGRQKWSPIFVCATEYLAITRMNTTEHNKCFANAKRPSDCSVLCQRPKSPHSVLDMTSFGSAVRLRDYHARWCNNGVGQFKPIFQVEGNTFRPILFGYFIADWLLYNFAAGSFHATILCSRLYSIEIEFRKTEKSVFEPPFGNLGVTYALHL